MAHHQFDADGDTGWISVNGPTWVHVDNGADFGGGAIDVTFQDELGAEKALMDPDGVPIQYTAGADAFYDFPSPVKLRLTLAGSTAPDIYVQVQSNRR